MQQYIRHSKTAKRRNKIKDKEWETRSVIQNPELNKHRRLFLGEPGSNKWKEYYAGWSKTKRVLFNETDTDTEQQTKRNTRKNVGGGDKCAGWFEYLMTNTKMQHLLQFAQTQQIESPPSWLDDEEEEFNPENIFETIQQNGKCNAEMIKIEYIPFFFKVYMQLIESLKSFKYKTKSISATTDTGEDEDEDIIDSDSTNSVVSDLTAIQDSSVFTQESVNVAAKKNYDEPTLRELLLFNIEVLRTLNMYANPMFFDDLYYYYYFLNLDKIAPDMDSFFRALDVPEPKKDTNTRHSDTNVKMRVYEQFPDYINPNPMNQNKIGKKYGYEIEETRKDDNPTNFDLFLNLVQLKPESEKIPVVAEVEKDFLFDEIPVDKSNSNQVIAKVQVSTPNKQTGGDFGFGISTSAYTYLDDMPLARNLEDVFKDENATYDGNVYMCIYSLDKSCDFDGTGPTPFLKFIATKSGNKWGFPSFHYTSLQNPDENNSSFKCELFDNLMKTLEIHLCSDETRGGDDQQQVNLRNNTEVENIPLNNSTEKPSEEVSTPEIREDHVLFPPEQSLMHLAKEKCAQIESSLDSMFIGIATIPDRGTRVGIEGLTREDLSSKVNVREEINGTAQLFAFLNYDFLETIVQTPENQAQTDLLFCRNADTKIYPITDSNLETPLKWATVDELLFEQKIMGEEVEPAIFDCFSKHHNLWNIEDAEHNYIRFPFSVFAVEIDAATNQFKTITIDQSEEHLVEKIDHYGTPESSADEYGERYCFTISPLLEPTTNPRRYAMFAWKTRYIVTDEQVKSVENLSGPNEKGGAIHLDSHPLKLELDNDSPSDSAKLKDAIANEKLEFPTIYTITQNEYTDNKPIITWGILNENQFVQL